LETLFDNKNFFKNSITELNEQLLGLLRQENSLIIYLNDESSTALHYFTQKERRINIITKTKERSTVLFWEPTQQLDWKKTSNALKPNTIHALDAALVRLTIDTNKHVIATIHDSFGAILYDIEGLINLINKNINLIYYKARGVEWYSNKQYYSIYIIL